ncbi:MAG: alkaline phosphatase [Bacteroidetes bacterium]|nr:alkaline phosphatase [Bacteroidota bacterium]
MRNLQLTLAVIVLFCFTACSNNKPPLVEPELKEAKGPNIILIIGDGTGLSQISSLWYAENTPDKPNYERFPVIGLSKTNSSSHKITDSGAGATAFAIGQKSYNGSIGVNKDSLPEQNIVELLSTKKYNSGIISTSSITHATPASFFAHVVNRSMAYEIADQLPTSPIDFFAGGGKQYFMRRPDKRNVYQNLIKAGFVLDTTSIDNDLDGQRQGYLLADDGLPKMSEDRSDFLPKATKRALDFLGGKDEPFFLMVEGSQVDWGGHDNNGEYIVTELVDLDKAIGIALDFAEKDGNTLVVAIADHETGGFSLAGTPVTGFGGVVKDDYQDITYRFTTGGHTASHVPVFAFGAGSEVFSGIYENNKVYDKLLQFIP